MALRSYGGTVGTTAARLLPSGRLPKAPSVTICNLHASNILYVGTHNPGGSAITATTGIRVAPNASLTIALTGPTDLQVIASAASTTYSVLFNM